MMVERLAAMPLFQQPFAGFLADVVGMFPHEAKMLVGAAETSPESAGVALHADAWVRRLFSPEEVVDGREFERAALALRHFYDVVTGNHANMPGLDRAHFERLQSFVARVVREPEAMLPAVLWSILFNDLGKMLAVEEMLFQECRLHEVDHDLRLCLLLGRNPKLFPGWAELPARMRDALVAGLMSGFNLAQAVQLECPAASWACFSALDAEVRDMFVLHALFDFFGVTGAVDPRQAPAGLVSNSNVDAFLGVAEACDYDAYVAERAAALGLDADRILGGSAAAQVALVRLAGMARIFDHKGAEDLLRVMSALMVWHGEDRLWQALIAELGRRGSCDDTAILPYYGPSLFANARKRDPAKGLLSACVTLARIFTAVRQKIDAEPDGDWPQVSVANLREVAESALRMDTSVAPLSVRPAGDDFSVCLSQGYVHLAS